MSYKSSPVTSNYSAKFLIKRVLKDYLRKYYNNLVLSLILMVVIAAASAFHVWLIRPALDGIFIEKNHRLLSLIPLMLISVGIIKGIATYYQNYLIKYIGQSIVNDMQMNLYKHLIHADISFLKKYSSGKLVSHFTNDITNLRNSIASIVTNITRETLTIVFLLAVMIYNDKVLSLIAFFIFPLAVIPIIRMGKKMRKISHKTQDELGLYTSKLDEIFKNIKIVKSFTMEKVEIKSTQKVLDQILSCYTKAIKTDSLTSPIMEFLGGIAIAAVIWYGGFQVLNGATSTGSFFSFIAALMTLYKPLKSLADINITIQSGLASATRIFTLLDTPSNIEKKDGLLPELKIIKGDITFEDVSFSHERNDKTLKNLTMNIKHNQVVALVGPSGGGKSTIIDLLLKFYKPDKGLIKIDEQDINDISNNSLRRNISLVSQDIMLFDDTIKENIKYGNHQVTEEDIIHAAKIAAAHEFIEKFPQKYDTQIGQYGLQLSGGQRQRICIARAILKKSPIIIFDEATSSLDQISEQKIKESIETLKKNHTIIVVAHRLATIKDADTIYVLNKGKIVDQGTHKELINRKDEYYKLYNRQTNIFK